MIAVDVLKVIEGGMKSFTKSKSFIVFCSVASLYSHSNRKDQKKVDKLQAQIPYHAGRGNKEEVEKINEQIEKIWEKTREAYNASLA